MYLYKVGNQSSVLINQVSFKRDSTGTVLHTLVLVSRMQDAGVGTRIGNETMFPSPFSEFKVGMERRIVGGGCFFSKS